MIKDYRDKIHHVNCLANDLDALYHRAALKFGISDSVMFVLYTIHDKGDNCLLYDICSASGISKQTINSAIRKLESDGILFLEKTGGRQKRICLTEEGKNYIDRTVARLFHAECAAFQSWTDEEIETYLKLMEKYNLSFRAELEKAEETFQ